MSSSASPSLPATAAPLPVSLPTRQHGSSHRPPAHHSHSTKQQQHQHHHPHHHPHHPQPPPHQHHSASLPHHATSLTPPPLSAPAAPPVAGFSAHFPVVPHASFPHFPAVPLAQPYGQSAFYHLFSLLISPTSLLSVLSPSPASHRARSALFSALSSLLTPLCTVYPPFLFGSTPLHTYLPSGDLDVGMVVRPAAGDGVATAGGADGERVLLRVKEILEEEERRWKRWRKQPLPTQQPLAHAIDDTREGETSTEESPTTSASDSPASSPSTVSSTATSAPSTILPIHSVTFINASEVKLVKCMIGPILVDISTNTSAALATVCFLEETDREIDRSLLLHYPPVPSANHSSLPPSTSPPHLLKQSILLIKSWCLYESHILASHHSLLSTYCLETLVIYILNHYHCHLHHTAADPFVVLSLFMHVFAVFNWEDWGLTVTGPVRKEELQSPIFPPHHLFALERSTASVPPLLASPFPHANHPLLSPSFFYALYSAYSLPSPPPARPFLAKHMNVVDPLDLTNNLGRSVSFSNLWRVRLCLRKGASEMVRILSEGRDCVEAMLREMDEVSKRSASSAVGVKGGKGRVWMEESEVLSEPATFQQLIASLPTTTTTTTTPFLSIVCPSLPFSPALLSRLSTHYQLFHSLFAHTWQHHTSIPRPDCHLVQLLREEGALVEDELFRQLQQDGEQKERATRPASTLSPTSATLSLSSTAASSLASEPLTSTLARRLLAMPSQPQSLSRDDSSLSLSLPPRAPASSRSLFITTLPHPTPARDVVAVSGTFSPLIEPSSCPPPSTTLSPRHSASCPPSPAVSVSPTLSPVTSPSPSPSPPLSDPLSSSLNALCQMFFPLKQLHLTALQSSFPAIAPPPLHPWAADGQRPLEAHRNGSRDRQQQHQQLQWGKGQGKANKQARAVRDRADRREEKERDAAGLFHPPTSPASASSITSAAFPADAFHIAQPTAASQTGQGKRNKKNGYRQQQQQQHQQQQHYLAAAQQQLQQHQHQQHQHHSHGLPPLAAFHMYPPPPAPYPQHNVRRQYVNPVPQPPYPTHGWHSVYTTPPPHHMQPSQPSPIVVSPNLSPASPHSANTASAMSSAVSRIHLLPGAVSGQVGVIQQVRAFLEPDDARSFAAVMQPAHQQHGRQQQQHSRGGSGGMTSPVLDSTVLKKGGSPQKQKQRSRGQAERRTEVPFASSPARPNRRRSDGEFPQPIGGDELSQPAVFHSATMGATSGPSAVAGHSSLALSMARSWSTAVGSARTSPALSAVPLSLSSPTSSLSSPALPSLLSEPPQHSQAWVTTSLPHASPPLQHTHPLPPPQMQYNHSTLLSSTNHSPEYPSAAVSVAAVPSFVSSAPPSAAVEVVGGVSGVVDSGALGVAVGGSVVAGGAVQYPGPPKGERRHKAKKERVLL